MSDSESDLISRARRGDDAACDLLVEQHQEAIFRLAYLLLADPAEAEDVAQETFIHALAALDRFDTTRPLRPWLLRITANLANNRRRAIRRYLSAIQRFGSVTPEPVVRPESEVARQRDAQELWRVVQRLERPDQEILYLRFFLELSVEETAEALSIAPGTVKSRLYRALERLRTTVEKESPALWEGGRG